MGATFTQALSQYKEVYQDSVTSILFEEDKNLQPILASMEVKAIETGAGRKFIVPIEYGTGESGGHDFSTNQTKAQGTTTGSAALRNRWELDEKEFHAFAVWTRESVLAAKGKGDQMFDVVEREMKTKTLLLRHLLSIAAVGSGFASIGTITAITASTITMASNRWNRVDQGTDLVASESESGHVLRSATSRLVTQIEPSTGVITLDGDPTALGWAVNDHVFRKGDRENSATPTPLSPFGVAAWVPSTAPGATTHAGVNRQGNPQLGGHRVSGAAGVIDGLYQAAQRLVDAGRTETGMVGMFSPQDYMVLCNELQARAVVEDGFGPYKIGFPSVSHVTAAGSVKLMYDNNLPQGTAYVGPWTGSKYSPYIVHSGDQLINIDDEDGNDFLRLSGSAAYEVRLYSRMQIVFPAPGAFCAITSIPA
jgi:hypothetical protein